MCLWILTACLGMLPSNTIVVQVPSGVPTPILMPTAAPSTAPTPGQPATRPPSTAPTAPPTAPPTTPPTTAPSPPPTTASTMRPAPPTTGAPSTTAVPTMATSPSAPPTTVSTIAPITAPPGSPPTVTSAAPTTTVPPTTTTIIVPTGAALSQVLICSNPNFICVANPDDGAGTFVIDPRFGTTSVPSAAIQGPPITGYTAQIQPIDSSVNFPREKRSAVADSPVDIKNLTMKLFHIHEIRKRQTNCACVPAGTYGNAGAGLLDVRIVTPGATQCPAGQTYCCNLQASSIACGVVQNVPATSVAPGPGQATFGEFPWQAMVLTRQNDYLAGGVLINQLHVLTVTHRLVNYVVTGTAPNVKVRLGEWDASSTSEPVPFQEYNVARVFTHPSYNPTTLQYDLTVLRLATAVPLTPATGAAVTINRACLPTAATATFTGQRCMVSGWGKNMFGIPGQYQQILKKVAVPIVAPATCQSALQTARLGAAFVLDTTSFVCAGGEANMDACTGDGGSALVCPGANGQWTVVGLVSWGLGCANPNVPGAYVNVAALLPWIQQQIST